MTPESETIAAMIDKYPAHIRERWLAALERIVEVYRASGVQESWVGDPPRPPGSMRETALPANVVLLRRRA